LIDPAEAAMLADLLRRIPLFSPTSITSVCRDPSDKYLPALAEISSADLLVTRDEDLLILRTHGRTRIVHVAEFLRLIAAE
jgi:predicted nucleic acid-binding protein